MSRQPLSGKPTLLFQRAILQRPLLGRSRNEEKGSSHEQLQHRAASSRNIRTIFEYRMTMWGDRIFEKCGIRRDEGGDGGKTLEIRGKRRLSARDGGANYQQS